MLGLCGVVVPFFRDSTDLLSALRGGSLSRQDSFGTPVGVRLSFVYPSPMRGSARRKKMTRPRGIKSRPDSLGASFLLSAEKKEPYELKPHGDERSGAARKRGCAGEEGAKPPDPESRGRSMTRGPRAGHDNGRRDAGPVSHTLWTQGSKGTLYVCEAVHMMRRAERQKAGSHTAHRSSSKTDDHTRDGEPPAGVGRQQQRLIPFHAESTRRFTSE